MPASQQEIGSVKHCQHAAEKGLVEAQYNLGLMYATGLGVARDVKVRSGRYRPTLGSSSMSG